MALLRLMQNIIVINTLSIAKTFWRILIKNGYSQIIMR